MNNRKTLIPILAGVMAAILLLSLNFSLLPQATAASSSEIKNQINDLKKEEQSIQQQIEDIKSQYKENQDEILNLISQKNVIDQEMALLYSQIANINLQLSAYNLLIADKQDELDAAEARLKALSDKNRERIRAMEEEGELSYWSVLFKANSFGDLLDRLNIVQEIAEADRKRLNEMRAAAQEVADAHASLVAEKAELEEVKADLDATQASLDEKRAQADELIGKLIAKGKELEGLEEQFMSEKDDLLSEIAKKEQEYNEAKAEEERAYWEAYWATYTTPPPETTIPPTTVPDATAPSGGDATEPGNSDTEKPTEPAEPTEPTEPTQPSTPGKDVVWLVPCSYRKLTSPYGNRESPTAGASTFHQGVDLSGSKGTPIMATRAGVVTVATYSGSGGNYVTINHGDGFSSSYLHMTHFVVRSGQRVSAGQVIGYMGDSGIVTGVHLHFSIFYNGKSVNPAIYINF